MIGHPLLAWVYLTVSFSAGFTCAYLIFISENLSSIYSRIPKYVHTYALDMIVDLTTIYGHRLVYVGSLLVPLAFLCNLRHLKALAPFRLLATPTIPL